MGLDMYLEKCPAEVYAYINEDLSEIKENKPTLYKKIKPYIKTRGEYVHWESLLEDIGSWRKANAIHRWFVHNVQNDNDDCGNYRVTRKQIEDLLDNCYKVRQLAILEDGMIQNGSQYKNGQWVAIMEPGKTIINPEVCEKLLPTQDGFFFGGTNYDEYYYEDILSTIQILENALQTTDWDNEVVVYSSSW